MRCPRTTFPANIWIKSKAAVSVQNSRYKDVTYPLGEEALPAGETARFRPLTSSDREEPRVPAAKNGGLALRLPKCQY
jgi:hypothetical protein